MRLDVIVPTYNRQDLLPLALNSLFAAEIPAGLDVTVTVVDNNSTDGTRQVIESLRERLGERIQYCFEVQQGRSHALNAGIAATSGDLVGIIDDDEERSEEHKSELQCPCNLVFLLLIVKIYILLIIHS